MAAWSYDLPVGRVTIAEVDGAVTHLCYGEDDPRVRGMEREETPLLQAAARQLEEYFAGSRREFDLPLRPAGTEFQQRVWAALREIPYGGRVSYGEIAARVGSPRGFRAVGLANNRNPISILIPCHRVVGKNGGLTGYAGGLEAKERLLQLES